MSIYLKSLTLVTLLVRYKQLRHYNTYNTFKSIYPKARHANLSILSPMIYYASFLPHRS